MPETELTVRYAAVGDVNIAYQIRGEGALEVIYVPGLLNLIESANDEPAIARHLDRLGAFARVVLFDKRGTGLSDRVPAAEMADAECRLDDLRGVMDAVRLERPVLFATADGCATAIQFAARHPERIRALVLYAPSARWLAADGYGAGLPAETALPLEFWQQRWGNDENPLALELLAPSVQDDPRWRLTLAHMERHAGTPRAAHTYWQAAVVDNDVRDALGSIEAPTLVVHAADDLLFPAAQGRFVADAIPGARYVEIPGGEHFFWFQDGDVVTQHIEEFLTGGRSARVGRRLVTVLFSDIVGSTDLAARLGDARWRDLLDLHDKLVRHELLRFGGEEVKFTGDGLLALFEAPYAAVEFAGSMIAGARSLDLELRVGIHTGPVEVRGRDVAGMAVNVAARLLGHAGASEIVVTRTVKDLLGDPAPALAPIGRHVLKGVPDEWELYRCGP